MPPDSPPSKGVRGFLKSVGHGAKKVLGRRAQATGSRTPSPLPPPPLAALPSQLLPAHGHVPQPPAQSHESVILPKLAPSAGQPALAASDVQSVHAESSLAQTTKNVTAVVWNGLRATLGLLERSSDAFPPLKSAIAGFLDVIGFLEMIAQNRADYAELALNLDRTTHQFQEHRGEQTSSRMLEALDKMMDGLQEEMKHVEEQQQRSGIKKYIGGVKDTTDVAECYKRVESLRQRLRDEAMIRIWSLEEEQQVDARLEKLKAALKAMYDSKLSTVVGRRKCTPDTRTTILAGMREWADSPDGPKVYWLDGMAGTGKTTLAYSFCAERNAAHRLGASFFCSRTDADSRDVSRIVPTIAYQLARLLPTYQEELVRKIGEDKDISERTMEVQFERLVRDPLREIKASVPGGIVIAVDALDECDNRAEAQVILKILLDHARDLPVKFLVTCRPEPGLYNELESKNKDYRSVLRLHNIEASFVQADIRTYLEAELGDLSFSQENLGRLAAQAGTLFIYAATAVRYINPGGGEVDTQLRLDDLLSVVPNAETDTHQDIDTLYSAVLAAPFTQKYLTLRDKKNIRLVLDTAVCAKAPMSVATMTKLLGLDSERHITYALKHLRSVLHVSDGAGLISTFHASFPDYMLSPERSKDLCCDAAEHNRHLALRCFSVMRHSLRFNICSLETSFILDEQVPDLVSKVEEGISPELFYACRYWVDHLGLTAAQEDVRSALGEFLSNVTETAYVSRM